MTLQKDSCQILNIKMLGVQPLSYANDEWFSVLKSNFFRNLSLEKELAKCSFFDNLDNDGAFKHFYTVKNIEKIKISFLENDFISSGLDNKIIDENNTNYRILLDVRFMYFIILYEISFSFPVYRVENILDNNKKGFYNSVRDLINKENDNHQIGKWAKEVREASICKASTIIERCTSDKEKTPNIDIINNTCNISFFITIDNISKGEYERLKDKFITHNYNSEKKKINKDVLEIRENDKDFIYFNGRFHTVFQFRKDDTFLIKSFFIHIQYMWFLLLRINDILVSINLGRFSENSSSDISDIDIEKLVEKVELLNLHDAKYKSWLEKTLDLYQKLEKNGGLINC